MRILQIADYGSPFAGSFVPMLRAGLAECEARGLRAEAVLPARASDRPWIGELDGLTVRFAPAGSRIGSVAWLRRLLSEEEGSTVMHTHFSRFDMPGVVAALGRPAVKILWHTHTVLSPSRTMQAANRVKLEVLGRRVERILCVAPHLAEAVIARGASADRVAYFPNGLDVDAYARATADRRLRARRSLGLPEDATVALHFGRDWQLKGGDLFLRAVRELKAGAHPDLVAVTARGGEPARRLATELGIGEAVFTPEAVEDVGDLYAVADLLMATSRGEGMPLTVLEALAGGLPVVASDIPGHDIPGADLPGLLIVPLESGSLAAGAARLLARPPQDAARDSRAARAWLEREMGLEPWARRLVDLYQEVA